MNKNRRKFSSFSNNQKNPQKETPPINPSSPLHLIHFRTTRYIHPTLLPLISISFRPTRTKRIDGYALFHLSITYHFRTSRVSENNPLPYHLICREPGLPGRDGSPGLAGRIKKKKRVAVNRVCLRPTRTPRVCFE
jgi:hypothetical protein